MMIPCPSVIFSGSCNVLLGKKIAALLHCPLGKISFYDFPDGERCVAIEESVRGKEVFVIQSIAHNPSFYLMELLMIVDAAKRASAKRVTAVIPYFGYARQDRKNRDGEPMTARLIADLLEAAGVQQVVTLDLHAEQIPGFFRIPVDHLSAAPLFIEKIRQMKMKDFMVVSPDLGTNKLAQWYAEALSCDLAFVDKRRIDSKRVTAKALIGNVQNKNVILVDDITSTGSTLVQAADVCLRSGARDIYAVVTHAVDVKNILADRRIKKILVTDSLCQKREKNKEVIRVAPLFAQAIHTFISHSTTSLA
ncbi:MAG: ribose-phosphate diphosphokinase [Parachlamydiales bacterium]|nr:ribose-phosphate diphosphokinase [Parachlamydiales bacterium]